MRRAFLAALFVLSPNLFAQTLSQSFHLPWYLANRYGNVGIVEIPSPTKSLVYDDGWRTGGMAGREFTYGRGNVVVLNTPASATAAERKLYLAENLLDALRSQDEQIENALADLENIRVGDPAKNERSANLARRVRKTFAQKLITGKYGSDKIANLWYRLKFESRDPFTYEHEIQRGEPVLILLHQSGYYVKSGNIALDLLSRIDFGHSALGIRYYGMGPERDLLINPGSKNRQFFEVGLPYSANPDVLNLVDVDNLWDWTETQIRLRYMKVKMRFLPLTPEQVEALKVLIPTVRGVNFGPAVATTNNCADGATTLVNFLMPIHRTVSSKLALGPAIPARLLRRASRRVAGSATYEFPNLYGKAPGGQTPGVSYKDQDFDESELTTFRDYLRFESMR
ncbi:MAG TPA: hypothetical protein VM901_12130 [Bdellovibrionota bacterium]|jgi:hypothetical protein|nr:hypothetical protein [Bdellovibrionota bacterium]